MKSIVIGILLSIFLVTGAKAQLEFITYNIRLNTEDDGEHAWPNRRDQVISLFKFHRAEIFCVQEALPDQIQDLRDAFPGFNYEGVGRDDGKQKGEFSAIFFNKDIFLRKSGGTFWLSETPDQCSIGWDAAYKRVCTWILLEERESKKQFFVFNTHFDHVGTEARRESARLIIRKIDEIADKYPIVLCGDFNLSPESEPIGEIKQSYLDAFDVSKLPPYGSVPTFHGFTYDSKPGKRIDYVFVSKDVDVLRYGVLTDSRDRKFFSDHLPVLVTLDF